MEAYDKGKYGGIYLHQVEGSRHDLVGSCVERQKKMKIPN